MTQQPQWQLVGNLGDVNVADYGGFLVYKDTTGVYPPEVELYEASDDETGGTMYRFSLDPPRFRTNGAYHQATGEYEKVWHREWFARQDKLQSAASTAGMSALSLLRELASRDAMTRARGYQALVGNFGAFEFDQYPVTLTEDEAQARYEGVGRAALAVRV